MAQPALMSPPARREIGADVYSEKLGIWIFLGSEVMFFTALIGSYIILRFGSPEQWSAPGAILNIPLTAVNTFLLICSSVTMVKAFAAIQDGDQKGLRLYLVATVIIGAAFVGVQAYEYIHLVAEGFLPSGYGAGSHLAAEAAEGNLPVSIGVYGSSFYTMTGFHGFHVSVGVIAMSFVTWKAFRGDYTKEDHRGVEVVGLYWHFVDLVWIILFTIVYLV